MYTPEQLNVSIRNRTSRDKHCIRNVEYDGIIQALFKSMPFIISFSLFLLHSLFIYHHQWECTKKDSFWQQKIIKNGNVITCHSSPAVILPKLQNINQIAFETLCRIFLYFHAMCYYDERNAFIL